MEKGEKHNIPIQPLGLVHGQDGELTRSRIQIIAIFRIHRLKSFRADNLLERLNHRPQGIVRAGLLGQARGQLVRSGQFALVVAQGEANKGHQAGRAVALNAIAAVPHKAVGPSGPLPFAAADRGGRDRGIARGHGRGHSGLGAGALALHQDLQGFFEAIGGMGPSDKPEDGQYF
jgi:hypothetical protein